MRPNQSNTPMPLNLRQPIQQERMPWNRRIRYRITETRIREPIVWLRHHGFRPEDVFLACYPKSGSTWFRFMLYEILTGDPAEFGNVNAGSRIVGEHFYAPGILPGGGRFIGTHETYRGAYHKVIYLVRDVRDVAISHFRREWHMGVGSRTFDDYLFRLMTGRKRHGSWPGHVLSYLDSDLAKTDQFMLVRYEDLRHNTEEVLTQVLHFLAVPVDGGVIRGAIQNNSLQAMRTKEDRLHASGIRVVKHPFKSSREEGRFVYKGETGGWRGKLPPEQLDLIDRYAGYVLARLGYLTVQRELQSA
ncbi:MAG: sulfotransferase [Acidobacteriaceae bacterium]|nr:sulfotransferase [Acidobacteriaceae bacterium]